MKKKKIELNQKLFLNKEKIASLSNSDSILGGAVPVVTPTNKVGCYMEQKPSLIGCPTPHPIKSEVLIGACNLSVMVTGCGASGNQVCNSLANKCGNGFSVWGNVCAPKG
jgi:hypothetical protein